MAYHEDILVDQNGITKCGLCKILVRDNDVFIEEHLNDKEHAKMFMQRLMIQNNISDSGKQITCCVCNQVLGASNVIQHVESSDHKGVMDSIKKLIAKDEGLVLPETISNIGSAVKCLFCDRIMDLEYKAIQSHIVSERHRRARAMVVQPFNAIFSVEGSGEDLWCKICQVYFENYIETIFEHVDEDPGHATKLGKILMLIKDQNISIEKFLYDPKEDKALCKKCGIEVPCNIDNLERHIKGKKHTT